MKIVNTSGQILTERPDYTKGRLLQDTENPDVMVFSPWDEVPLREEENPEYGNPLQMELASIDSRLHELDYIGTKIATGRGTREEYATEIAEMQRLADRKNEILYLMNNTNAYMTLKADIENKVFSTRQEARNKIGTEYSNGNISKDEMTQLTVLADDIYTI